MMDATPKRNAFAVLTSSAKRKRPSQAQEELDQSSGASNTQNLQPHATKADDINCSQQNHQDAQAAPASSQQPPPAAANAFSYLMAEQREQSQVVVFFLEQMPDKTWETYWWTKGPKSGNKYVNNTAHTAAGKAPCSKAIWSTTTQILSSILQSPTASGTGSSKSKVTVQLQTNVAPGSDADLAQMAHTAPGAFKGSTSLLKSALQKNVRLCRAAPAVRCALQLMKDNAGEFLRRVSIICLEDALLHPEMPLLVWLMCAQAKGYTLGVAAASACLQIVYQLACMPVRDSYPTKPAALSTETAESSAMNEKEELLVRCIAIRAAYGGMAGDVDMLKNFVAVWSTRFLAGPTCPYPVQLGNQVDVRDRVSSAGCTWLTYLHNSYTSIPLPPGGIAGMASVPLKHGDVPLSAVDFHISSIVEELMQKPAVSAAAQRVVGQHGQRDAHDPLRRAMWLFRSSVNTKKEFGQDANVKHDTERQALQPIWQAAHAAADAWSTQYIRQRFG